jgi:hypothetical protein
VSDIYNSKIARFVGQIYKAKNGWAITISSTTTLYSVPVELVDAAWRRHEECHKQQWRDDKMFLVKYFMESAKNGYLNNKYEIAARAAENK